MIKRENKAKNILFVKKIFTVLYIMIKYQRETVIYKETQTHTFVRLINSSIYNTTPSPTPPPAPPSPLGHAHHHTEAPGTAHLYHAQGTKGLRFVAPFRRQLESAAKSVVDRRHHVSALVFHAAERTRHYNRHGPVLRSPQTHDAEGTEGVSAWDVPRESSQGYVVLQQAYGALR